MNEKDKIVKTIRTLWDSLDSHLDYTYGCRPKRETKIAGGVRFHRQCVRDYFKRIKDQIDLLMK